MAHDDPYADGYVPSEWDFLDNDGDSVPSIADSAFDNDSYLPHDDGEEDDFEYKAFIESLNDLRATSPDTSDDFYSSFSSSDLSQADDLAGSSYSSYSEEFDSFWGDTGKSIWDEYDIYVEQKGAQPYNSESYTAMTAHDSGYSLPYPPPTHLPESDQYSGDRDNLLPNGSDFGVSESSKFSLEPTEGKHHLGSQYPSSTRFPVSQFADNSVLSESSVPDFDVHPRKEVPEDTTSDSSTSSSLQDFSSSALAQRVLPKSPVIPQSPLSSVVVDRSSRRGGRHAQPRSRVFPSSHKLRQVSAEFLARRKSKQQASDPEPVVHPSSVVEEPSGTLESSGTFMTSAAWLLVALVGLLNMGYWHLRQLGDDWASLWIAGLMVRNDQTEAIYDRAWWDFGSTASPLWSYYRDAFGISPWPHPFVQAPIVAQIIGVISRFMNYYWSLHLLAFLTGAAIVISVISAHYIWKKRPLDNRYLVIISVMLWISQPAVDASYLGQTTPILFSLLLFGIAVSEDHPYAAGAALAVATLIKLSPFVVIIILLFFVSRRRAAVAALVTILLSTVISVAFIGPRIYADWFKELGEISSQAYVTSNNHSLMSLAYADRASDLHSVTTITHPAPSIKILAMAVGVLLALCVLAAASQLRERACEILTVGVFIAALVSNNIFWSHYTFIVIALYLGIFFECTRTQKYIWPVAMISLVFFYPPISGNIDIAWQGAAYWATVFLLLLFCVAVGVEAHERSGVRWTPGLFLRNIADFITAVVSTGSSGTAIHMRS